MLVAASCYGQGSAKKAKASEARSVPATQAKLKKTQGTDEYQNIHCGLQDKGGNMWFGTTGEGVYRYDGKSFTQFTTAHGLSSNSVLSILENKAGYIWFGTSEGICRFDGKKILSIPVSFDVRPVINDNSYYTKWSTKNTVWSMMQDKSGLIWFGTGDGVYWYNGFNFTRLLANGNVVNKDNVQLRLVASMTESKGNIWFASGMPPGSEGLCRYDGKMIERFKPKNQLWIRKVIERKNGNLLLLTRSGGILSYDGSNFTDHELPKEIVVGSLTDILEDKSGNLWVASDYGNEIGDRLGGLWRGTSSASSIEKMTFTKVTDKTICSMVEDKDGSIWLGARGMGLFRYDGKELTTFSE